MTFAPIELALGGIGVLLALAVPGALAAHRRAATPLIYGACLAVSLIVGKSVV